MNWAKQSKWSLVPLNTPWAGGSVWPFAAQHLSSTVSVSSLSFNPSLPHLGSAVQRLSLLHYTMGTVFFVTAFSLAYPALCERTQICVPRHAHGARIYTRINTAWHASLLSQCAELRGTAGFQLELMNSVSAGRGEERKRGGWSNFTVPLLYLLAVWIHRGPCKQTLSTLFNWVIRLICIQESKLYGSGK